MEFTVRSRPSYLWRKQIAFQRLCSMKNSLVRLAITATSATLLYSASITAQTKPYAATEIIPPAKQAAHVQITQGPELESANNNSAIIEWTSNNPGGSDEHFGVVTYGTNPKNLNDVAKSHTRLNQNHPDTVFRVRVEGLQPQTTYYYVVDSMGADGRKDGVKSPLKHFTTR
jgi:phosphodiesterase/alkaline phosphatase D-like protein